MNFKFKLSRRIARMKIPALLAGTVLLGCQFNTTGAIAGLILGINVSPPRYALLPSQSAPLTIAVASSKTDSAAEAWAQGQLQWSVTGGTISNNGLFGQLRHVTYTAPAQPGTYLLIVTTVTGWPADTASFAVSSTPVPVASVSVSPATVTLALGDTATLGATLADASGEIVLGRAITWTSSDNTVAMVLATGFVRAMGPGSATITATSETQSGSAVVTVPQ